MRRMFSNRIAKSAKFLQMPLEAQALYFHSVLNADDDGVVEIYPLTKLLTTAPDVLKILIAKNFLTILNEDQVMLVNNWLEHNKIRSDRKIDSIYKSLIPKEVELLEPKPRSDVQDNSQRLGGQSTDGISKDRLGKDRLYIYPPDFEEFYKVYPKKVGKPNSFLNWKKLTNKEKAEIMSDIPKRKKDEKWLAGFVKDPERYIKNRQWEDEIRKVEPLKVIKFKN